MGSGIAQAAAQAGYATILYEVNEAVLERARDIIGKNLDSLLAKGKISRDDRENTFGRIRFSSGLADCRADIYIEAIVEDPSAKIALFRQLEEISSNSIFASNTSSLAISTIAAALKKPGTVVGMHFFNPATIMKLVEVVKTPQTNPGTIEKIADLARSMGKTPVICTDSPGFIVNRVARPYYIESLRLVEERLVDYISLDNLMEATGFRMGPYRLMDLIGNDVNYAVSCSVYEQLNRPGRLRPSTIQEEKVKHGELGRKTGKGYYSYS
jgi:3-hydroxybutyryl-CoA dehydrogenase